ncbi:MAG: M1 family aminopeptidase [Gemmatimonadota bacterium]
MSVRHPSPTLLSVLTAVLLASCDRPPPPPPTDLGIPWELAEHRHRTISNLEYRIDLEVPEERSRPVRGRSVLGFGWDDPSAHPVVIDFLDPGARVQSLKANGVDAVWSPVNDHIVIDPQALEPGFNRVEIEYVAGDEALNRGEDFLYTLFVPDRAHFSLPVFDQPNLKASVTWTLRVPRGWRAMANGPQVEMSTLDDRKTLSFLATRPIPTYLFAFAAGRFEEEAQRVNGRMIRMFHRETDTAAVARNRDAIFELHGRSLDWLEEYTGIEYPFQKFDFVLIPSFQYGGMEHPGSILYRQDRIMLDESATQGQVLGRASLIAHETSHMWFGDLVTMNWFDDVWTKEVFANFMAAKIVHPSFPDVDHDLRFLLAHHPPAYEVDRTQGANAVRQPLENLQEAGTLYGAIIYQKAPIVMRQLEERIGSDVFRDGLRQYLRDASYGNATWPDLIDLLDRRSAEDLVAWSRVWVEEPGRPTVRVSREADDLILVQEDPAGRGRVWPQTLHVGLSREDGDTVEVVELADRPVRIPRASGDVRYALPNASGLEYGLFLLDEGSLAYLSDHAGGLESALERGAAWVTLWDQVLEGRLTPAAFLDVALASLAEEEDELILGRLLGYLSTTYWRLLTEADRIRRAGEVEGVLWAGVTGDRPVTARASFLGTYREVALTPEGVARLQRLWAGEEHLPGLPLSESDQTALARELALREVAGWSAILDEQEARITNPDRRARFRFARPSLDADPAVRTAFFEALKDPANREREPWVLAGLANLHHPLRSRSALPLIRPGLAMIEEIQRTGDIFFPQRWLGAVLGGHNEPEAAEIASVFLEESPELPPRLRGKVLQSADMVWRSASLVHGWRR